MICFPNAKINIGLHVLNKRQDGFHNIETVFYPAGIFDVLEIVESGEDKTPLDITGISVPGNPQENLCLKAYQLLKTDFDLPPVKMHLHKVIPAGAGLGGGSSDAAFTLKCLNSLFELKMKTETLQFYAAKLGSDCAFFIPNTPCIAYEKGDRLEPVHINLDDYYIVIVFPDISINTKSAYANINTKKPGFSLSETGILPVSEWKHHIHNDFESYVFQKHPEIKKIKEIFYDCHALYASLTGSGSAVYGLFKERPRIPEEKIPWKKYIIKSGHTAIHAGADLYP